MPIIEVIVINLGAHVLLINLRVGTDAAVHAFLEADILLIVHFH